MRGRFIWSDADMDWVPRELFFARRAPKRAGAGPMVMQDIAPYKSAVDGSVIGGRRQHREHLRAHGCVEVGNEFKPQTPAVEPSAKDDILRAMRDSNSRDEARRAVERARRALD